MNADMALTVATLLYDLSFDRLTEPQRADAHRLLEWIQRFPDLEEASCAEVEKAMRSIAGEAWMRRDDRLATATRKIWGRGR